MSTRLAARWLSSTGLRVRWLDAREVLRARSPGGATGPSSHLSAECACAPSAEVQRRLADAAVEVTITQGFIARDAQGDTVLLGRGGSDTSASYLASMLEARRLEIWTDVPGLFTSDPRRAASARLVPRLTYDEAAVLGALGARILHPRCLAPVKAAGIPLHIRWTRHPEVEGTIIDGCPPSDGLRAVTSRDKLCLVIMRRPRRWQPIGFMAGVARCFERHLISMDLVSSSTSEIRATVDLAADPAAAERLPGVLRDLSIVCEPALHPDVMCVSIVGTAISSALEHISGCLRLFATPKVHLVSHAADDTHLSFVVDRDLGSALVTAVHDVLFSAGDGGARLGDRWSALKARSASAGLPLPPARPAATAPRAAMEMRS
ncbi:MAG: hypothetical protein KC620_23315, partial [Myxococcales bacterium]|nr:hypothetical protein [Myxococcales bacterium]